MSSAMNVNRICAKVAAKSTSTVVMTSARGFAHNPKWLRDQTRAEENVQRLKRNLLDGTLVRKSTGVRRRIQKTFGTSILPPITERENVVFKPYTTPDVESWIFNAGRERVGIVPLDKSVYDADVSRTDIIHTVVNWQRACARQGTHMSMNRHEMSGSTRKYRAQKGTGTCRVGKMFV